MPSTAPSPIFFRIRVVRDGRKSREVQDSDVIYDHALVVGARSRIVRRLKLIAVILVEVQVGSLPRLREEGVVEFLHLAVDGVLDIRENILNGGRPADQSA